MADEFKSTVSSRSCPQCGTEIPKNFLACPGCQRLVYADRLNGLSHKANQAEQDNRLSDALASWREALELLPPRSKQYEALREKITDLGRQVDGLSPADSNLSVVQEPKSLLGRNGGKAGLLGLLAVLLSKLKILLLGLAKLHTLLSMLLAFGIYWTLWGWKFALGFVLSIYIHEMGHVAALNRYGIKATAPLFIPGVGAFIRLQQKLTNPREDARVGLAGPIWGLVAALTAYALFRATGDMVFAAIAQIGAWINLFNLMPVWQLDGGRGFQSLARWQRWVMLAVMGLMLYDTGEKLLMILMVFAVFQAFRKDAPAEPDHIGLIEFAFLVVLLSIMTTIPVQTPLR
jgi:Zn-dependent protease